MLQAEGEELRTKTYFWKGTEISETYDEHNVKG